MHGFETAPAAIDDSPISGPWWKALNRYHWFVLIVAALGWLFDTMDQQLFNLARVPAMKELLKTVSGPASVDDVAFYGGISTSVFLMGWAAGGLAFGIMGDRVGRAKTMLITILLYSLFTGLSALSWDIWSFSFFRFLTGLGVGGEFAVGVSLVAEVMPSRARPFALGLLQALSAVGNITAALVSLVLFELEESGAVGSAWRWMFVVGAGPALLAILIRRRLKEPEKWSAISDDELQKKLGSYGELFSHPRWRHNALVGMTMAFAGVVGLWGIGFFSVDLNRSVFKKTFEQEARIKGEAEQDRLFIRQLLSSPEVAASLELKRLPDPSQLLNTTAAQSEKDALPVYREVRKRLKDKEPISAQLVLTGATADGIPGERLAAYVGELPPPVSAEILQAHADRIIKRAGAINSDLGFWVSITSIMLNIGAFFGIYAFTYLTDYVGRRIAFAVTYVLAFASTVLVFAYLDDFSDIFWMIPLMGFCQLALFGGFAIYFPELFPTHLRSTGTSFCYNVGRFVAAAGPLALGGLQKFVFPEHLYAEPMRWAGVTMCGIFLVGLLALPFAPETRGKEMPT